MGCMESTKRLNSFTAYLVTKENGKQLMKRINIIDKQAVAWGPGGEDIVLTKANVTEPQLVAKDLRNKSNNVEIYDKYSVKFEGKEAEIWVVTEIVQSNGNPIVIHTKAARAMKVGTLCGILGLPQK